MEHFISYETAKQLVVFTGCWFILYLYIWGIGHLLVSAIKWIVKKVKKFRAKRKAKSDAANDSKQEQ